MKRAETNKQIKMKRSAKHPIKTHLSRISRKIRSAGPGHDESTADLSHSTPHSVLTILVVFNSLSIFLSFFLPLTNWHRSGCSCHYYIYLYNIINNNIIDFERPFQISTAKLSQYCSLSLSVLFPCSSSREFYQPSHGGHRSFLLLRQFVAGNPPGFYAVGREVQQVKSDFLSATRCFHRANANANDDSDSDYDYDSDSDSDEAFIGEK